MELKDIDLGELGRNLFAKLLRATASDGSLDDMKADTNAYAFCSYNVVGRGMPLNCGPTVAIDSPNGWNSETEAGGCPNYAYRILKPNKK